MEPGNLEQRVIDAAQALATTLGKNPNHTVGAAAMDTSGQIHTAVNVHHFTGGPCAELVVLGVAAAAHAGPLIAMASAGDQGRGLIPPCGRCCQVMLDLYPDLRVAVPTESGPQLRPIANLLPDALFAPDPHAERVLRFHKRFYEPIMAGKKLSTARWNEPVAQGPAIFYFEDDEVHGPVQGQVLEVNKFLLDELTPDALRLTGDDTVSEYIAILRVFYPQMPANAVIEVADFILSES